MVQSLVVLQCTVLRSKNTHTIPLKTPPPQKLLQQRLPGASREFAEHDGGRQLPALPGDNVLEGHDVHPVADGCDDENVCNRVQGAQFLPCRNTETKAKRKRKRNETKRNQKGMHIMASYHSINIKKTKVAKKTDGTRGKKQIILNY